MYARLADPRLLLITATVALWACSHAAPPMPAPEKSTLRSPTAGPVMGATTAAGAHAWRGIPYAEPPVGELRWRAPRAAAAWTQTLPALAHGPGCPQFSSSLGGAPGVKPGTPVGEEDCLTLNVYAPPFAPGEVPGAGARLPVMVWIYGGGNTNGVSGVYDGSALALSEQVIVVTVNYRLGPFGWLRHPALAEEASDAYEASGNFGTLDLVRALEWVRDNISAFGGDASRVTIFGESAGGENVLTLLLSPRASGLFHRAISQSGGLWSSSIAEAEAWRDDADPGRASSSRETLAILLMKEGRAPNRQAARSMLEEWSAAETRAYWRSRTTDQILDAYRSEDTGRMVDLPRIFRDGKLLPDTDLIEGFERGDYNRVPVILGTNRDEQRLYLSADPKYTRVWFGLLPRIRDLAAYDRDADYASALWKATGADEIAIAIRKHQSEVWVYRFDWDEEPSILGTDVGKLIGAAHGIEIDFVLPGMALGANRERLFDASNEAERQKLSRKMRAYWSAFAHIGRPDRGRDEGDPALAALPEWKNWSESPEGEARFIVFDSVADGNIRIEAGATTTASVVSRALADARFTPAERCQNFARLVETNVRFGSKEYAAAGCAPATAAVATGPGH